MNDDLKHDHIDNDDCLAAMDHLYAYLNGELKDNATSDMIKQHLSHCKSCFSRAEMEREINKRLKKSGNEDIPNSLKNRLQGIIDDL